MDFQGRQLHGKVVFSENGTSQGEVAFMACLQSFDPLLGGPAAAKNSSGSLKEDSKDDRIRRQHEPASHHEDHSDVVEQPLYPASPRWMWVEQQGLAKHRTFIAAGERYEMVRLDSVSPSGQYNI